MLRVSLLVSLLSLDGAITPPAMLFWSPAQAQELETPTAPPPSSCVTFQGRVRYSLGYDHLVDIKNGCTQAVLCAVTTNVNPEPINAHIQAGESTTVVTFIGSPAREFQPRVECQYAP